MTTANLILPANAETIARAADRLRNGELVAFPTETVYGLGADATNDHAVAKVFEAKGRPQFNPLIVHVASLNDAEKLGLFTDEARMMAQTWWPGPLTLIVKRAENCAVSLLASAGLQTIALRCPRHDVAQDLIKALGKPIAAPSANRSGGLSPTTPVHAAESLGEKAGLILAGGKSEVGLESTILDLSGATPALLRFGAVTREEIESMIGTVEVRTVAEGGDVRSPGQLLQHYAPDTPLRLAAVDVGRDEALLAFGAARFMGIKGGGNIRELPAERRLNLSETGDLVEAAANLFSMLHTLDKTGAARIAVMSIPDQGLGLAINDRLRRAAG